MKYGCSRESDADTDNRNDIPHDTSHRESNCGGRSQDNSQNLNDASRDTSQPNSIYRGESRGTSERPSIARIGDKFASYDVHHTIFTIMREHLTKPWITFRMVPKDVRRNMYNCFKTRWSTNLDSEQSNFEAFINVLKDRYSDMMYNMKITSTRIARNAGCDIAINDYKQFNIIRQYPPDSVPDGIWAQMCDKRVFGREPNFREIFLLTHLDKASKAKLLAGELNLNSVNDMFFCNDRSKEAYASYLEEMIEKNGLEFSVDDPDVWSRVVEPNLKRTRRVYGIGSSDLNYVVTGIASSSSGVTHCDTQHVSQKKIHDLEVQIEAERRSRLELEEEIRKERQERLEERQERLEMQQQMKEFMKFMQRPTS
ncbi:hypothetical protein R6Q59_017227 [Mikania micrantha]